MNIEEIKELIRLVNETGVAELEVERGDARVRIQRAVVQTVHNVMAGAPVYAPEAAATMTMPAAGGAAAAGASAANAGVEKLYTVKSPIVGTFYSASSPEAAAFVKAGDAVSAKTTVCIIESMKLMNEIEAEVAGTIVACLVENGKPVEYGEALFQIQPN